MAGSLVEFQEIVHAVLTRFYAQAARPVPAAQITRFVVQLGQLVVDRGLPKPLRDDECGAPGSMSEQECGPLVARVIEGLDDALLVEVARQVIKACFYPEFKMCRDSFREISRDGACRRQEIERVRGRISGTHCVDCPHWVALGPAEHVEFLRREWRGDPQVLAAHREIFLPEDFRALRCWLYAAARQGTGVM